MPKFGFSSILALASVAALPSAEAQIWITFDLPGTNYTYAYGLNDNGDVTGFGQGGSGIHGYVRTPDGTFTTFDPPGSLGTYPGHINSAGTIVGYFEGQSYLYSGFVRTSDGTIATFAVPNALSTTPSGLNGVGQITGGYELENGEYGFEREVDGTITRFAAGPATSINDAGFITGLNDTGGFIRDPMGVIHPGKPVAGFIVNPVAINDSGIIAGYLSFDKGGQVGFVRPLHGPPEFFGVNGSRETYVSGMNASGAVIGYYTDPLTGVYRGFVRAVDGNITLLDCPGEYTATQPFGINASSQVVGACYVNNQVGFLYTP